MEGLPTAPLGKRLIYNCNGYSCYYLCLVIVFAAHVTGIYPITYLAENYGEALIASIIIADATSLFWYFYGLAFADEYNGKSVRTGNVVYDFFMGTILYPRIGEVIMNDSLLARPVD
jgi:delta24(24(1))-sterol reductase